MPDKATRERLKRQAAEQKGIVGPVVAPGAATVNVIVPDIRMNGFEMVQKAIEAKKPKKNKDRGEPFRYPHRAVIYSIYDDVSKKWTTTLTIDEYTDTLACSGIHGSINKLGIRWRRHLANQKEVG